MNENKRSKMNFKGMKCYYWTPQSLQNLKGSKNYNWNNKDTKFYKTQELKYPEMNLLKGFMLNFRVDKNTPYLINMSEDPSLSGCLLFYLKNGDNSFGSSKSCDNNINGLGIKKYFIMQPSLHV